MMSIELAAIQNQSFNITLDNNIYDIRIFQAAGQMCCDMTMNNVVLFTGQRIVMGQFIIPFAATMGNGNGNFMLLNSSQTDPYAMADFNQFGVTQTLYYYTGAEMVEVLAGTF